jgi:hypothetical protein
VKQWSASRSLLSLKIIGNTGEDLQVGSELAVDTTRCAEALARAMDKCIAHIVLF